MSAATLSVSGDYQKRRREACINLSFYVASPRFKPGTRPSGHIRSQASFLFDLGGKNSSVIPTKQIGRAACSNNPVLCNSSSLSHSGPWEGRQQLPLKARTTDRWRLIRLPGRSYFPIPTTNLLFSRGGGWAPLFIILGLGYILYSIRNMPTTINLPTIESLPQLIHLRPSTPAYSTTHPLAGNYYPQRQTDSE